MEMSEPVTPSAGTVLLRETEEQLIRQAQKGDESALEALLSAHQDLVYRTALRFLGGREEAAFELAQEVLVSAFRHISRFRGESRFSTWLYRITANLAKNRFVVENRERARFTSLEAPRSNDSGEDQPRDWADDQQDVRSAAAGREKVAILLQRLETLEPEWREVLVLRFFEDLSYEEIAEVLRVPVGTVKSRLNRARRALREAMGDVLQEGLE
jgi:RNA polymerase sigma-70 factor (ECF subfamily)